MRDLHQVFDLDSVTPEQLDWLLASGWRHFGTYFFRYSRVEMAGELRRVIPLRIRVAAFDPSRGQRRIRSRNQDLEIVIRETVIDPSTEALFERHKTRFAQHVPDSIWDFLSQDPATVPCRNHQISLYRGSHLLAASFLDLGARSTSAVYAIFEPAEARRSLGIALILAGIEYTIALGMNYYYPGYAYLGPSIYDYKKRFTGLEYYDWNDRWLPYREEEE
jgi:arginyl-tRNA--protein-N-Asp/Glu arginylyltransferase